MKFILKIFGNWVWTCKREHEWHSALPKGKYDMMTLIDQSQWSEFCPIIALRTMAEEQQFFYVSTNKKEICSGSWFSIWS
jgi:hypothetical protein